MAFNVSNFYLNTLMKRYEYVKMRLANIPDEVVKEYKLHKNVKVTDNGFVYVEVRKGMYGLPQAGILTQQLLKTHLNQRGYYQNTIVPGIWKHKWRLVQFTLVVDNFGVKYVGKEHTQHLIDTVKTHYDLKADWKGRNTSASNSTGIILDGKSTSPYQVTPPMLWQS